MWKVFHFKAFYYAPVVVYQLYLLYEAIYLCNKPIPCFIHTAVFNTPKVIAGPNKHIKIKLNDSISLQCQFRAPFEVTIVVWLKDNLPVKNTQHYNIITTTNPGVDDLIVSNLNINTITSEDEGIYTCYCYYNRTVVTTSKYVVSNEMSTIIHLRKGTVCKVAGNYNVIFMQSTISGSSSSHNTCYMDYNCCFSDYCSWFGDSAGTTCTLLVHCKKK